MNRITEKNLQAVVRRINEITGSATEPYTKGSDGQYHANIGNYHLDHAYGGVSLCRMYNEGGGTQTILGRDTKRGLYNLMHAYVSGLTTERAAA